MRRYSALIFFSVIFLCSDVASAQSPKQQPSDDVIRVNTDLVQSAVTVLDQQGRFVIGLSRDQFELLIDGKPRPIAFLEQISAGSSREAQLSAQPALAGTTTQPAAASAVVPVVHGRTIIFFLDDMHMSADSLHRTREMLRHVLHNDMGSRDSLVIATASSQLGFLEQFTSNREVLNTAVDRLVPRQYE